MKVQNTRTRIFKAILYIVLIAPSPCDAGALCVDAVRILKLIRMCSYSQSSGSGEPKVAELCGYLDQDPWQSRAQP